jgi:thiol-disulfide isomerase/thioredoxin
MDWAAVFARCLLCVVFFAAGLAKLFDLKGSRKAITDFGLPAWSAKSLGIGLPAAEIAVALLILPSQSVRIGALGALVLTIAFSAAIAINIALGRRPDCHCFGQVHSKPVGWGTFARSGALACLAGFLAWHAKSHVEYSLASVVSALSAAQLTGAIFGLLVLLLLGGLFFLVLHLFRQNGRLLLRIEALEAGQQVVQKQVPNRPVLHGLPVGTQAIPFDLPTIAGGRATLDSYLRAGKPVLLISTDPNCGPCNALMPDVATWQSALSEELTIVILSRGRSDDNRGKAREHGLSNVLVAPDHKVAEKYQALGTPTGVLIRSDGTIGSPAMGGADAIRQLVNHKAWTAQGLAAFLTAMGQPPAPPPPAPALPVGSVAPVFTLPDANGNAVSTAGFNGSTTALLFWNPGCGFCQRMLPQLQEWELRKAPSAPRLVLVSGGTQDANRAMGLRATVLIDEGFAVGQKFGCRGTPSAVLIDANGKLASTLVVGAPAVLSLLSGDAKQDSTPKASAVSVSAV